MVRVYFLVTKTSISIVLPNKDNPSIKDKCTEFSILVPKCPLLGGFPLYRVHRSVNIVSHAFL